MDNTPPASKSAAPVMHTSRWIVACTIALWVIGFGVWIFLSAHSPDEEDPFSLKDALMAFPAIPGFLTAFLQLLLPFPSESVAYCIALAFGIAFAGLEVYAWWRRITWLAWVLLAWLVITISTAVVLALNSRGNEEDHASNLPPRSQVVPRSQVALGNAPVREVALR